MDCGDYQTLTVAEPAAGVGLITLNRPDRLNAMTVTMFDELEHVARVLTDDDDVRVVILTGAGAGFCAGYDLDDAERLPDLSPLGMFMAADWVVKGVMIGLAPCRRSVPSRSR